jgi:hypothetical protein
VVSYYLAMGKPRVGDPAPAVVIVDEDGTVSYRHDHALGVDYQSVDDLEAALDVLRV